MSKTPSSCSFDAFLKGNEIMLDSKIIMSHYSEELLNSELARKEFAEPDREPIPRHEKPAT